MTSRKIAATYCDYDKNDCVNTGHEWTLYADGRVVAETYSRWQGTVDGARYSTDAGHVSADEMDDPAAALEREVSRIDDTEMRPCEDSAYRKTRRGYLVR